MARSALPMVSCRLAFEASSRALISSACFSLHCLSRGSLSRTLWGTRTRNILDNLGFLLLQRLVQDWCRGICRLRCKGRGLPEGRRLHRRRGDCLNGRYEQRVSLYRCRLYTHLWNLNVRELALELLNLIVSRDLDFSCARRWCAEVVE